MTLANPYQREREAQIASALTSQFNLMSMNEEWKYLGLVKHGDNVIQALRQQTPWGHVIERPKTALLNGQFDAAAWLRGDGGALPGGERRWMAPT